MSSVRPPFTSFPPRAPSLVPQPDKSTVYTGCLPQSRTIDIARRNYGDATRREERRTSRRAVSHWYAPPLSTPWTNKIIDDTNTSDKEATGREEWKNVCMIHVACVFNSEISSLVAIKECYVAWKFDQLTIYSSFIEWRVKSSTTIFRENLSKIKSNIYVYHTIIIGKTRITIGKYRLSNLELNHLFVSGNFYRRNLNDSFL